MYVNAVYRFLKKALMFGAFPLVQVNVTLSGYLRERAC